MLQSDLHVGDVLVQSGGEPWVTAARILTGHPFPHAAVVSSVGLGGTIYIIENGKPYPGRVAGVYERGLTDFQNFEVWRPNCDFLTRSKAVDWMRTREGEVYGYVRMIQIATMYRWGRLPHTPGMDDDPSQDIRPMVCSELIAMGYYRSGYDLVPEVENRDTMPWDLRNTARLTRVK
jgi:hypothetical protein